ncbi:alpha/beta hydrolase [Rufibacter latericius]|uniref:Alpha/beta hydrolase n=1 Tax=Rufibacter latericius TaxID=2487040 RepID=A0A3M9MPH4_9BACT|nr:alpha/beta hydrolase [Rufibacter latericius]RNI26763.1 alpha/beta hydrolase [Rufibacter latericius]
MKIRSLSFLRQGGLALAASVCFLASSCESKRPVETESTSREDVVDSSSVYESSTPLTDSAELVATSLKPTGAKPVWADEITGPMQAITDKLGSYHAKPIPQLTAQEARLNPTPTTAVMDLMKENNIPMPPSKVDTVGKKIPVTGGQIHARVYTPQTGKTTYPIIVYYHGGGWVIADLDTYDASARGLAEQADAVVISVAYRQAPENKFPTAHNDSFAAYKWALKNAASLKGDPKKVAVVGESAGGNLAAAVSMMARDQKVQMPVHQVLVYPIAGTDTTTESYRKYAAAKPLDKPMMAWFFKQYLRSPADGKNPWINLVGANLKNLPPTTIINAQLDPLQTEGRKLAERLETAGVTVDHKLFKGVTHEFFGMAAVLKEARDAQKIAVDDLKESFEK